MSPEMQKELEKQVTKQLEKGLISPSESAWGAPVLIVLKKPLPDGSFGGWRLCVDFRHCENGKEFCKSACPRCIAVIPILQIYMISCNNEIRRL